LHILGLCANLTRPGIQIPSGERSAQFFARFAAASRRPIAQAARTYKVARTDVSSRQSIKARFA
jgi:hypothetical protein